MDKAYPAAWVSLSSAPGAPEQARLIATRTDIEHRWWKSFEDPVLDRLIDEALAGNKTVQIAEARVEEARSQRGGTQARLFPDIAATGSASRANQGYATNDKAVNVADIGVQASWEIDLFGQNCARTIEATAALQAFDARHDAAIVVLLADVARNYFDLRSCESQITITTRNLETQRRTLDLIRRQQTGALTSDLDVERAAAQVSTTSAQLPSLRAGYAVALNRINILLGVPPGTHDSWLHPAAPWTSLAPTVLIAAPAAVLANRPDVRAAERSFAASLSATDAATRAMYPTISLPALFGVQDSSLLNATPWAIGAGLVQPVLNFGRIQSQIDVANARQKQAFLSYQETVLEALGDMENALSLYLTETERRGNLAAAVGQNRRSVELADKQYVSGYIGLLDVLVAQRSQLEAEASLASSESQLRKNLVYIYTAAGGGWSLSQ